MTYYFSYRNKQGKKNRYRIGNHTHLTPAQARDIAETIARKVASGEDVQETKKHDKLEEEKTKLKTLTGFMENKYKPWMLAARKSGNKTIERIQYNFADFMPYPLKDIDNWLVEKWRTQELNKGKMPSTINRDLVTLKAMLAKAVEWNFLDFHPLAKLKQYKTDDKGKVRYLSAEIEIIHFFPALQLKCAIANGDLCVH